MDFLKGGGGWHPSNGAKPSDTSGWDHCIVFLGKKLLVSQCLSSTMSAMN